MKYVLRLIAAIPMIAAGLSTIVGFVLAIDYHIIGLYAVASVYSFIICATHYESTCRILINIVRVICDKTPCYEE